MYNCLIAIFTLVSLYGAQSGGGEAKTTRIGYAADNIHPLPHNPDARKLVGNVVFWHNGAAITCDSAISYSDNRMSGYGNVLINKDSTFVYGEEIEYDGDLNTAIVKSRLVKVRSGDATLYTYQFSFNTQNNIGRYGGGGTIRQGDNHLESRRGYYYADTQEFICVEDVEATDSEYWLVSDSVRYDTENEIATFYTQSYIWNTKGEILSATSGRYFHGTGIYDFTSDSYILTDKQEAWADSMYYDSGKEELLMLRNIQLRDDEQYVMAFGDYGRYWGKMERALLMRDPSIVSFDPEEDSLYICSDTMLLYSLPYELDIKSDTMTMLPPEVPADSLQVLSDSLIYVDSLALLPDGLPDAVLPADPAAAEGMAEDGGTTMPEDMPVQDSLTHLGDSVGRGVLPVPDTVAEAGDPAADGDVKKLSRAEQRRLAAETRRRERQEKRAAKRRATADGDTSVAEGSVPTVGDTIAGGQIPADSAALQPVADTIAGLHALPSDSVGVAADSITAEHDSLQRVARAWGDVKIFRNDFQAVCDSLVGFSKDSTMYMYIAPVMWSENNQIMSEHVEIFTKNKELDRVLFTGDPISATEIDSIGYNQIKGRTIEAFFRAGKLWKSDVVGNAQGYYYSQEDEYTDPDAFATIICANMTFLFYQDEDGGIESVTARSEAKWTMDPIELMPPPADRLLPGFSWESERRPSLGDVFKRTIRPTRREAMTTMPRPVFDITRRIDDDKLGWVNARVWIDREDELTTNDLASIERIKSVMTPLPVK